MLIATGAADTVLGGPGNDMVIATDARVVDCGPGDDRLVLRSKSRAQAIGCEAIELRPIVEVPTGALMNGNPHTGALVGGATAVAAGSLAALTQNVLRGGPNADHIIGTDLPTVLLPSADLLLGGPGNDVLEGLGGNDHLEGEAGDDLLLGGDGDDLLYGRTGDDRLDGGPGNDLLEGGRGTDVLRGGPGRDRLNGGLDPDRIFGGPGDDVIVAMGGGADVVDCGPGVDKAYVDSTDTVRSCETTARARTRILRRR
ncbi:MAG: hypothetical protein M3417_07495 [Actinomycetota bacterium]|nr:hypothetical protein [Actinomycetota bacterium]